MINYVTNVSNQPHVHFFLLLVFLSSSAPERKFPDNPLKPPKFPCWNDWKPWPTNWEPALSPEMPRPFTPPNPPKPFSPEPPSPFTPPMLGLKLLTAKLEN